MCNARPVADLSVSNKTAVENLASLDEAIVDGANVVIEDVKPRDGASLDGACDVKTIINRRVPRKLEKRYKGQRGYMVQCFRACNGPEGSGRSR